MRTVSTHIIGVDDLLEQLTQMTPKVRDQLVAGMNEVTIRLQSYIVSEKLSGDPLARRSGHLSDSIQQDVLSQPEAVTGRVSTNLGYARVHEDGGEFWIPAHLSRYRSGNMMDRLGFERFEVRGHYANYKKRAFMRPSYQALKQGITQTLREYVFDGLTEAAGG